MGTGQLPVSEGAVANDIVSEGIQAANNDVKNAVVDIETNEGVDGQDGSKKKDTMEQVNFSNIFRILSYSSKLDRLFMFGALFSAIGAGVTLPLMNVVFGNLTNQFSGYFIPGSGIDKDGFLASINQNALYIVYLFIAKFFLSYISLFSLRMISIRVSANLRLSYLKALFSHSIGELDKHPSGQVTNSITSSANTIQIGISDKLAILIQSTALVVAAYVVAFKYCWQLTLVSSSTMLFIGLVYGISVPNFIKLFHYAEKAEEEAATVAGEVFGAMRTVLALGAQRQLGDRYEGWVTELRKRARKMDLGLGIQMAPIFFSIYANYSLTFWYGVKLFNQGTIGSIGTVITVFFSILIVVTSLGSIAAPIIGVSRAASASVSIFKVIDAPRPPTAGLKEPEVSAKEDVVFENVVFAYPSRPTVAVLKKLNLRFQSGKTTAIVGPSGSGKSTIVALLERWYNLSDKNSIEAATEDKDEPDDKDKDKNHGSVKAESREDKRAISNEGAVLLGSKNIESLDLKWWRSQIGLVQQEPFLFNDTIFHNIAYGLVGSKWEKAGEDQKKTLVENACKEAFADEFIRRLPKGYETPVGEGGIKLSGGQRQRLAIARSIVKQPVILILDEATSSIDVRGERIVQAALDRVSRDRTTITIAHRLSTIKKADNIIVLREGVAVEEGAHNKLLENPDGVYSRLVNAQNLVFLQEDEIDESMIKSPANEQFLANNEELERVASNKSTSNEPEEKKIKPGGVIRTMGRLLGEQRLNAPYYLLIVICAMGAATGFALQSYIFAKIIQVFQYTGQQLIDSGNWWSLMFFVLALCEGFFYFWLGYGTNAVSVNVSCAYRNQYFEGIIRKPIVFYDAEENSSGSLNARLSTDPKQMQELLGINMIFPLISIFQIIGCIAISFAFGWKLTLVALFAALPVILASAFVKIQFEIQFESMNAKVFAESSKFASEAVTAFRTVTSLTLEDTITERYDGLLKEHVKKAFKRAVTATFIFALSDSIELPCMALTFWYGGQLLSTYEYDLVQFFVIYSAIIQGGQAAGAFLGYASNIALASAAGNRILSLRHKLGSSESHSDTKELDVAGAGASIEFKSVSFKYPTRDVPVFYHLNLMIEPGQFVGLVGPSGCGKTTVVSLLERFYDARSGEILVNGTDIKSLDVNSYRKSLALVSQEPTLFEGTIRSNLLLGIDALSINDQDIEQACKDAEIHDFIISLPQGYATSLGGKSHASLSGGQKQRLCIARAILRRPAILLLDEATSSLDSQSERIVQSALERVASRRSMTVVAVAHRLATVQRADTIIVFGEAGGEYGEARATATVIEKGTHSELIRQKGAYWGMCQAQALDA